MENEVVDLMWLDDAFAKGLVDVLEASCCLSCCSPNEVRLDKMFQYDNPPSYIKPPEVSRLYGIIQTWPNITGRKPLLWYIEQAVMRGVSDVKYGALFLKCKENEYRRDEIIKNYPKLAKKLGLVAGGTMANDAGSEQISEEDIDDNQSFLMNPKDRNDRLFRRAIEIASKYENVEDIVLKLIHEKLVKEEKGKSDVSIGTLKRVVKLGKVKLAVIKLKSEKVK